MNVPSEPLTCGVVWYAGISIRGFLAFDDPLDAELVRARFIVSCQLKESTVDREQM